MDKTRLSRRCMTPGKSSTPASLPSPPPPVLLKTAGTTKHISWCPHVLFTHPQSTSLAEMDQWQGNSECNDTSAASSWVGRSACHLFSRWQQKLPFWQQWFYVIRAFKLWNLFSSAWQHPHLLWVGVFVFFAQSSVFLSACIIALYQTSKVIQFTIQKLKPGFCFVSFSWCHWIGCFLYDIW